MVEYDMLAICQMKLSFKICNVLLQVSNTIQSNVSALLGVSDYLDDAFRHSDGI